MPKKSWLKSTLPCSSKGGLAGLNDDNAKHLARALAVACGDDGGIHVDEAAILEETMNCRGRNRAHAENGAEQVGARAKMLLRTQEFDRRTLLLQRVIRSGNALDHDIGRRELEGLRRIGGELQLAGANQRGGNVLMSDLVIILRASRFITT